MRRAWATAVLLAAAGLVPPAAAQPLPPADPSPPTRAAGPPPSILGAPVAVRGEPVRPSADPIPTAVGDAGAVPVSFTEPPAVRRPDRAAGLGAPTAAGREGASYTPIPAGSVDAPDARTAANSPPPADPVNDLLIRRSHAREPRQEDRDRDGGDPGRRPTWKLGDNLDGLTDKLEGVMGQRGEWFKSDHAFDGFVSPVTNPFLFEDPRSLTEVRPIYLYQKVPGGQPDFKGGNAQFFGAQARLAITDRLSFVVNKLGGVRVDPGTGAITDEQTGFAELWLGPKFTFVRNEEACRLLAGGLQFQIPVGSGSVYQDTGNLSLVPWATIGQNFFKDFRFGSVNTLATGGYALSTNSARSDYLFLSGHVDLDVMNRHRFYPLAELNYVLVTTNGNTMPLMGSEGRDLFNFGSQAKGNGLLTGALGARFKFTENAQIGGAFEIPLAGPRDLFDYRFTVDFILRY